jgi:hypothetical protein
VSFSPNLETYHAPTGSEFLLRLFPEFERQVILLEPLLEERNFLRRTVLDLAGLLGGKGIGTSIPDLPGCGESLIDAGSVTLSIWRDAVANASTAVADQIGGPAHIVALRGGALIDDAASAASWWRFAPANGHDLLRPFRRAQRLRGEPANADATGYGFAPDMISALEAATPVKPNGPLREVAADPGSVPLWNRAEPSIDIKLAQWLADDISQWIATCDAH